MPTPKHVPSAPRHAVHRKPHEAPRTSQKTPIKSRYIPALDGLRAFAVLVVIAYHMGLEWAPGGLLGVTVFFVMSGYLITSLLLIEWDNTHRIDLPQFWLRRIRRLMPAIIFLIIGTAALCTIFDHSLLTKLREDMWAALLWVTNWWYIFQDVSYFDALGAPSPLTHFWSLAIEEQFYLFWPLLLLIAHKAGMKRTAMRNTTLILAIISTAAMALLYDPTPGADPSRVYYGTDTRAFSLLIGAWLAFMWPSHLLGAQNEVTISKTTRGILDGVGFVCLAALVAMVVFIDGLSPFWYYGGTLLASICTAVLIAVMVHPSSIIGRLASAKPFVWIGVRSYGIYLWHYPILLLMGSFYLAGEMPWWMYLVELALIFAISMFSYRFVEDPIRKGAIGKFLKDISSRAVYFSEWIRIRFVPVLASSALVLVAVGGLIFVPPTSALEGGHLLQNESAQTAGLPQSSQDDQTENNDGTPQDDASAAVQEVDNQPKLDVLMIGDSVSVRTIPYFAETFPYGAIDSAVNRQFYEGIGLYQTYSNQNIVGNVVVFALGTNGAVTSEQIDELLATVGSEKQVFFVNTRSPQPWVEETNWALYDASQRYENVHLIDWYGESARQLGLFDGDGTHLSEHGAQVYTNLIHANIAHLLPVHSEGDEAAHLKSTLEIASEKAHAATQDLASITAKAIIQGIRTEQPAEQG